LQDVRQVSLSSVNGTVNLTMPSDANAQVRASTVHGNIENGYGIPVRKGQYVGRDLSATLGSGAVTVKLQNVNGGIYIKHAQDNRPLSPVSNVMAEESDAKDVDRASRDAERVARQAAREARAAAREATRVSTDVATAINVETRTELAQAAREQARVRSEMREVQRQTAAAAREASYVAGGARYRLVERDTKTFAVNGIARVHVNTFDGSVVVRSWDKNEVSYTSVKRAADEQSLRSATVDANQSADSITISTRVNGVAPPDSKVSVNAVINFEVYVPRNTELTVDSGDGRLTVEGVKGKIDLKTGDGPVSVVDSKGTLSVDTKDGGVRLEGFDGAASVHTGEGRISLSGNFSQLNAETREGTVSLRLPATANASLETTAEDVENDGIAVEEPSSSKTVRRWKVGTGGSLFRLRSGEGRIYLRKAL
jgi:hypothetical protein